ncbi:hypothetical protein BKK52_11800 [Rodentibacter trehalosifermentans]|uniref:EamA domain-containing protein n=1 Tax=Rodentibacter trehalosifermentans TaxID=1908263 RepID=A0A1V3IV56_9PAST|nr:DMT family transporter [Rodentibacter trehalosifermentans]OOF46004.1 hypothetical protein BKK52_11800 [Rodentibacter trehalosifermentans]
MNKYTGYLWGILSGLLWGISGIFYEKLSFYSLSTDSLKVMLSLLFIIEFSSFIFFTISYYKLNLFEKFRFKNKNIFLGLLAGIIGGPVGMLCYLQAIQYIGVGYAAPISSIYPVFGTIFAFLFLKDSITKLGLLGLCLSIGCTILLGLDITNSQFSILGFILAVTCAVSWGSEIIISSYIMQFISSSSAYFLRQLGSSLGYVTLILYLDSEYFYSTEFFKDTKLLTIIIFIIFSSMMSYFLYYRAIYIIKPIRAMMLNITYSFWIIFISFILNKISMDIMTILLVIGVILGSGLTLKDKKERI